MTDQKDRSPLSPPGNGRESLVQAARLHGVRDERVIAAFLKVPRARFVPPDWVGLAYVDRPIPIAHGQVTTQPSLIAQMVAALQLEGSERVLEIGTGLGFQTAILASLAAEVFSIERFPDLAEEAKNNLQSFGCPSVTVVVGDGTAGLPEHAPFDAIVVSAAAPEVPLPLVKQLHEAGRIVHPVGPGGMETVIAFRKQRGRLVTEGPVTDAHFVRLVGEHGLPEERAR